MATLVSKKSAGPLLVAFAGFLWATDALVRYPAIDRVDPTFIVFVEHILAVMILLPWLMYKQRDQIFSLNAREWAAAAFSGIGGSALGTVLFTASFLYINPSVAVLLQKLQPIMVVIIAYLMLGERPNKKFYFWGVIAFGAGLVLSFPDLDFHFLYSGVDLHSKGIQYAFGAALLWAASTVTGKVLLQRTRPVLATFWRFFFGFLGLLVILALAKSSLPWSMAFSNQANVFSLLYLSLIPGLLAMLVYYSGLSKTSAGVSTFIELVYPIGAVALNTIFLHTPLGTVQTIAGAILVFAVAMISF